MAQAVDHKKYFVNDIFTLTFKKIVTTCSLLLVTEEEPCAGMWGNPGPGVRLVAAFLSPTEDLPQCKGIPFFWLVFPKEADVILALITFRITRR